MAPGCRQFAKGASSYTSVPSVKGLKRPDKNEEKLACPGFWPSQAFRDTSAFQKQNTPWSNQTPRVLWEAMNETELEGSLGAFFAGKKKSESFERSATLYSCSGWVGVGPVADDGHLQAGGSHLLLAVTQTQE